MVGMTLENIAKACNGKYLGEDAKKERLVSGVAIDSRRVGRDYLFVPIVGERVDGHDFISQVFEKGALCTLSEKELDIDKPYILVENSEQALKDIAEYYRSCLNIKVIGITGSVGKTSTKEVIASVLAQKYKVLKTEGNYNNEIGLPLTIFRLREEDEIAVLEMGISEFGEMSRLAKIARPDICIITNIGYCHIESLGSRDGVLKAKTEIFEYMNSDGNIILNGEDDKLQTVSSVKGIKPIFIGDCPNSSAKATTVSPRGLKGTDCTIEIYSDGKVSSFNIHIPIPGKHMVNNALVAAKIGMLLGLSEDNIASGVSELTPVNGRINIIDAGAYTLIDDCYNANPISMKASIDVLNMAETRKVAILGDMFELGENEVELHKEIGKYLADKPVDVLIAVGSLSRFIAREALTNRDIEVHYYNTLEEMLRNIYVIIKDNDTILIKASHSMKFNKIIDEIKEA